MTFSGATSLLARVLAKDRNPTPVPTSCLSGTKLRNGAHDSPSPPISPNGPFRGSTPLSSLADGERLLFWQLYDAYSSLAVVDISRKYGPFADWCQR
jgi:hypothetical protein